MVMAHGPLTSVGVGSVVSMCQSGRART
jgi:hypothetical protein